MVCLHQPRTAFAVCSPHPLSVRSSLRSKFSTRSPPRLNYLRVYPRATAAAAAGDRNDGRVSPSDHTSTPPPPPGYSSSEWQSRPGVDLLLPDEPELILAFIGGFAAGLAPRTTYAAFLRRLSEVLNAAIVAYKQSSPSPDHLDLAHKSAGATGVIAAEIRRTSGRQIPLFGIGHSLGAKCLLLAGCQTAAREACPHSANIFISFNNSTRDSALPWRPSDSKAAAQALSNVSAFLSSLDVSQFGMPDAEQTMKNVLGTVSSLGASLSTEFRPTPEETVALAGARYSIPQNLVISFDNDSLDHSEELENVLRARLGPKSVVRRTLPGTHLTPMTPDIGGDFRATGISAVDDSVQKAAFRVAKELDQTVAVIAAFVKLQSLIQNQ